MQTTKLARYAVLVTEVVLLVAVVAASVLFHRPGEWSPPLLAALLLALAFFGEWFSVEISDGQLSASFIAIVLAVALLGPTPAAACGIVGQLHASARRRLPPTQWLSNLSTFTALAFAGGLLVRALAGNVHDPANHVTRSVLFGLIVFFSYILVLGLDFLLIGLDVWTEEGHSLTRQMREYIPLIPGELAGVALAAILAIAYTNLGLPVLFGSIVVILIFQRLTAALLRSEDRAEQLEARSRQLVGLQLGVLRTLVRALGMRDKTTGRHAAAVARYARDLAAELGCNEEERDMIHAAGLLHEIGKFTWPDRVLHADVIQDEDLAFVKNHPQEGSVLVGALDGYGPVADAILYHRERVDGGGYPAGLIGKEIPLGSRILAICSTYDTITAPDGYRTSMEPREAMDELRHGVRNGQFDGEIVEAFIAVLEREGPTFAQDADFETELEFERRVRDMAQPRSTDPTSPRRRPPAHDFGAASGASTPSA
jgi:HD-GYP domain-containing protein (c-di-GMP phosphodiesterase class II)